MASASGGTARGGGWRDRLRGGRRGRPTSQGRKKLGIVMKGHAEFPELEKAIDAHAHAIIDGDIKAASAFLSTNVSDSHSQFVSRITKGAIKSFVKLARARIGM